MSNKQSKRTRNVAKDLTAELLSNHINPRLDAIEDFCQKNLTQQNERSKNIQGWIVRTVQFDIANQLHNMQITMDAFINVLTAEGIAVADLDKKIDAQKVVVSARLQAAAEERMKQAMAEKEAATPSEPEPDTSDKQGEPEPETVASAE